MIQSDICGDYLDIIAVMNATRCSGESCILAANLHFIAAWRVAPLQRPPGTMDADQIGRVRRFEPIHGHSLKWHLLGF